MHLEHSDRIQIEGKNCWKIEEASRAAFLVDASNYFEAFADAVTRARNSIYILGWDIDSRISLVRDRPIPGYPDRLGDFLNDVVSRKPGLTAHVLIWDFAMIYALEREVLPVYKLGWKTHSRLKFRLDGYHPLGASHHQKIVVIDDSIAFVGGLDLTKCRWDTPGHPDVDARRYDPGCSFYSPFHDIQMAVEGNAAEVLGALARERWRRATGENLEPSEAHRDIWPPWLTPDIENVLIGVSRTEPAFEALQEIREVESLFRDSILSARDSIYIENQYLTSAVIGELLASRLAREDCPEIVIILPRRSSGWLEESTMDALRTKILLMLTSADQFGKLALYYPSTERDDVFVNVHSKVMIIDDRFLRVGSANLSNRSMGLDTECDLSIESRGEPRISQAITRFRNTLVGEHLGVTAEKVLELSREKNSLDAAIKALGSQGKTLVPFLVDRPETASDWICELPFIDPERAAAPTEMIERLIPEQVKRSGFRPLIGSIAALVLMLTLAAAWQWTPLRDYLNLDTILYWAGQIQSMPAAPLLVIGIYMLAGFIVFPVTLLIVATAVTFDPLPALGLSLTGSLTSAAAVYLFGQMVGRQAVRKFAGAYLNRLSRSMGRRGILTIITLRIFPVAPFSVVNFIAGASHIQFRDYMIGSAIGLFPGLIAITILGDRLGSAIRHPGMWNFLLLAFIVVMFIAGNVLVRKWLERRHLISEGLRTRKPAGDDPPILKKSTEDLNKA